MSIPEPVQLDEEPTETNGLKRRQSEAAEDEQESKRQRISPGKNSPAVPRDDAEDVQEGAPAPSRLETTDEPRRKASIPDEKQRSKRLFGALLGNLNQSGDNRASKRRQEIESRRKAELQRQDDERVEDRLRSLEKLAEWRKKEQVRVNEEDVSG